MIREQYILWRDWEQRTPYALGSYCTGTSPRQPAHASSPTLPHSYTANGEENNACWALQCSPLLKIHQSLKFNYRKDIYILLFSYKLYMGPQYDYHIVCVPNTAEMTSLIMYDFLLCGKLVDEWFIEIGDKPPLILTLHFLICMARNKPHLAVTQSTSGWRDWCRAGNSWLTNGRRILMTNQTLLLNDKLYKCFAHIFYPSIGKYDIQTWSQSSGYNAVIWIWRK